jgi:hypothetical protein
MYQYVSAAAINPTTRETGSQTNRHRRVRQPTANTSTIAAIACIAIGAHPPSNEIGAIEIACVCPTPQPYLRR